MYRQRKKLSVEQVNELQVAQDKSADAASAMRFQAVRLYGTGYRVEEIKTICGCSRPSLMEWNRKYHQGGIAALLDQRQGGNRALLSHEALEALQRTLHQYQPHQLFAPVSTRGMDAFGRLRLCRGWSNETMRCTINESAVIASYSISATSVINAQVITICRGASKA